MKKSSLKGLEKISAAFTLAEVLITIGIIGVVAAMTLPSVINETRNKHTLLRLKSYILIFLMQ